MRPLLESYFGVLILSTPFLLAYAVCRRYLQGMHAATPVMFALVTANLINAAGNWVLIYGHFGFPALGVAGIGVGDGDLARLHAGVAAVRGVVDRSQAHARSAARTSASTAKTTACGTSIAHSTPRGCGGCWRSGCRRRRRWARKSACSRSPPRCPGTLDPISSASHQIALNLAGVAFMIPLGLGSAGAVRVGHAVGAGDRPRAAAAGWTAILLAAGFMMVAGV